LDVTTWVELPLAGGRLASIRYLGSGEEGELVLTFADGRRVMLPVSTSRVEAENGITVKVSPYDDVSLRIEYIGPELYLRSGRFAFPADDDADFLAAAQRWLAADCATDLGWVVNVEMCLGSR
jgi:hypothetical protein